MGQVISMAKTYNEAVLVMRRALMEFQIRGVKTNIDFLQNVLKHPVFESGNAATSFIEQHSELFTFTTSNSFQSTKLLTYLAEMVLPTSDPLIRPRHRKMEKRKKKIKKE